MLSSQRQFSIGMWNIPHRRASHAKKPHFLKGCFQPGRERLWKKKKKRPDRRVLKTKKAIRNALAQLLAEKELEEITVKEVADTADINRKTFYNYYAGVHQVIDEIENEIISTFDQAIREVDARRDIKNPYTFFEKITAILNQDLDFYSHLFRMRGNLSLSYKITTLLKTKILTSFLQEHSCDPQEARSLWSTLCGE